MAYRAHRYLPIVLLGIFILAALPGLAAPAGSTPPPPDPSDTLFASSSCAPCAEGAKRCNAQCATLSRKEAAGCAAGCENAAALCSCDDKTVTLRSEDVAPFPWPSYDKAACHSTTPCGSGFPSCASWSLYANCGDPFCGFGLNCGEDCPDCPEIGPCHCPGPATRRYQERFRVCFAAGGASCTEYQSAFLLVGCGC